MKKIVNKIQDKTLREAMKKKILKQIIYLQRNKVFQINLRK